ncbi:molybdopterin-guanine dinucleotide biosynthesis protein B [Sporosarcina sp. CAU 1771]
MKTLHIVGFKNSGKTTLISRWVRLLKKEGDNVAVLKHHGHGGPPELPDSSTDTMQFLGSGADVSVVAGGGIVQLHMNEEPSFLEMKTIATQTKPDILLIEGYKEERGEKVVLLRDESDWDALKHIPDIRLVVRNRDNEQLDNWLLEWRKGSNETI